MTTCTTGDLARCAGVASGTGSETSDARRRRQSPTRQCLEFCVPTPGQFAVFRQTTAALGLHAGLGLSFQVGRSQLFTEFRVQTLTNTYYGSANKPVTLGIRF